MYDFTQFDVEDDFPPYIDVPEGSDAYYYEDDHVTMKNVRSYLEKRYGGDSIDFGITISHECDALEARVNKAKNFEELKFEVTQFLEERRGLVTYIRSQWEPHLEHEKKHFEYMKEKQARLNGPKP
ncbi:hypothetical protein [Sphingobacterium siyangense]|uniref:hypothetical protein n=1 Tax=Sphingobacterium siyangense TaxID=459529 RepID=UPI003DA3C4C4